MNKVLNRGTAETAISSLKVDRKKITGDGCIAETVNHHITTVSPKLAAPIKSLPSDDPLKYIRNTLSARIKFKQVSNTQVLQYLQNLKPGRGSESANNTAKIERFGRIHFPSLVPNIQFFAYNWSLPSFSKLEPGTI